MPEIGRLIHGAAVARDNAALEIENKIYPTIGAISGLHESKATQ